MYSYVYTYYNFETIKNFKFQQRNLQGYVDKLSECFKNDKSEVRDKFDEIKNLCEDTMKLMVSLIHGGQS